MQRWVPERRKAPLCGNTISTDRTFIVAYMPELDAHLHIDMESLDSRDTVLELVLELLSDAELASGPSAGVVLQAYLHDSPAQLERILRWARTSVRRPPLTVRLVKGAYWDHELVQARQHGWEVPAP